MLNRRFDGKPAELFKILLDANGDSDSDEIPDFEAPTAHLIVVAVDNCNNEATCMVDLCQLVADDDDDSDDSDAELNSPS